MSIRSIKRSIDDAIQSVDDDLLIIKGNWGVGKTHLWRTTIIEARDKGVIGKQNYAYISLFGLDSIEEVKEKLLVAFVDSSKAHQTGTKAKAADYAGKLLTDFMNLDWTKKLGGGLLETIVFESLQEGLICFDDVERRGPGLDINQLFGFADFLKEQRKCKVVFILNDSKLKDREKYNQQKEKIAGLELEFSVTTDEAFDIVFKDTHTYYTVIKECCLILSIRNIRTLQRIDAFLKKILIELRGKETRAIEAVIRSLILFVWAYYDKEDDSISLEAIRAYNLGSVRAKIIGKKEVTDEEKKLEDLLTRYGRWYLTDIDIPLMAFVEKGFLDKESFNKAFDELNEREISRRGNDDYHKAWEKYSGTLTVPKIEFVEELVAGFEKNVEYVELHSLDSSVKVLRGLNEAAKADSMIELYLKRHRARFTPEFEQTIFFHRIEDARLKADIKDIIDDYVYVFDFAKTLEHVAIEQYCTSAELAFLDSKDVSVYAEYFMTINSSMLYYYIKGCLDLDRISDLAGHRKGIADKTKQALTKIANMNDLNKFKLDEWFGGRF
jgi:hypothetical protein